MKAGADLQSIEALEDCKAAFCCFAEEAKNILSSVQTEIQRTFSWLEEQRKLWQREIRRCQDQVTQAKNDLARRKMVRIDGRPQDTTEQEKALRIAQQRLAEAEAKFEQTRRWQPLLQRAVEEYQGLSRQLANYLDGNIPRATAQLNRKIEVLAAYTNLAPSSSGGGGGSSSSPIVSKAANGTALPRVAIPKAATTRQLTAEEYAQLRNKTPGPWLTETLGEFSRPTLQVDDQVEMSQAILIPQLEQTSAVAIEETPAEPDS